MRWLIILSITACALLICNIAFSGEPVNNQTLDKAKNLLNQLTLAEKISLLSGKNGWSTKEIERLSIPSLRVTDGPHGIRTNNEPGGVPEPNTGMPTGVGIAATWNRDLVQKAGEALGEEVVARDIDILLGPCINLHRTPLGGRNFESFSEDPYLAGEIGAAFVNGIQSKDVGVSVKHFACNNQEADRFNISTEVDERTLREIYLAPFRKVITRANPWTVMCSYNKINSVYASANRTLLTDILRHDWGYNGVVISDWGAVHDDVPVVKSGLNIEMGGPGLFLNENLLEWMNKFAPFGPGNMRPNFYTEKVMIVGFPYNVGKNHLKLKVVKDGCTLDLIGFNLGDFLPFIKKGSFIDIAYSLEFNTWQGRTTIQGKLKDIKFIDQ